MLAEEWNVSPAETGLFDREYAGPVVDEVRLAGQRQGAGGIDVGKVGADRLLVAVDQAVREGDPQHGGNRIGHDQGGCVAAQA